jgi:hypothetical protein
MHPKPKLTYLLSNLEKKSCEKASEDLINTKLLFQNVGHNNAFGDFEVANYFFCDLILMTGFTW